MDELEDLRVRSVGNESYAAAVAAVREKVRLSGLATQKIEVSEAQFTDTTSAEEILAAVAKEKGPQAAWHLAMAFGLSPDKYGIMIDGEVIAESGVIGGNGQETRPPGLAQKTLGRPSVIATEAKPRITRREIG